MPRRIKHGNRVAIQPGGLEAGKGGGVLRSESGVDGGKRIAEYRLSSGGIDDLRNHGFARGPGDGGAIGSDIDYRYIGDNRRDIVYDNDKGRTGSGVPRRVFDHEGYGMGAVRVTGGVQTGYRAAE